LQGAPVQGESPVGTAVIHRVYPAIVEEEGERMPGYADGGATGVAHVVQPGRPHEPLWEGIQRLDSFPAWASL
jgi:hypothetical protein